MAEAKKAMGTGDFTRAIALYSKVLALPEGEHTAPALELLGLARERNGQRAHARAEYELYLTRFPDGPGAERVRQRLEALRTSRQPPRETLRRPSAEPRAVFDAYGSIAVTYQRAESFADLSGAVLLDSSPIVDLDATAIYRSGRWDARGRASGFYRYDLLRGGTGRGSRIRYLYLDLRDREWGLRGVLGRQAGRGGGVLGRFDGLSVEASLPGPFWLGAAFGFPADSAIENDIDTSRIFAGVRLGMEDWIESLNGEVYAIGQSVEGLTDRIAVGGLLRYATARGSLSSAVDFDVQHSALNLAMVSGSVRLTESTTLNALADYRSSPFLTTRSALIGRPETSIEALRDTLSTAEIEQLARDRTTRVATLMLGLAQRISTRWRLSGDFTTTSMSSTRPSGGVWGTPATGWEYYYSLQAMGSDLLLDGDDHRVGIRFFDSARYRSYTLLLSGRYPLSGKLRISPLLTADYRDHPELRDMLSLRPGLRLEYRHRWLTLDTDVRGEWLRAVGVGIPQSERDAFGYTLYVTLRLDF